MSKKYFGIFASILMILTSGFTALPATAAEPSNGDTVTKTITVRNSSGALYAGVEVGVLRYDDVTQGTKLFTGEKATTNSLGVASLEIPAAPSTGAYFYLVIQPPASDLTHATMYQDAGIFNREDQAFEFSLQLADKVVEIQLPDGTPAPIGSSLIFQNWEDYDFMYYVPTLRTGPFGVALNENIPDSWSNFQVRVNASGQKFAYPTDYQVQQSGQEFSFWKDETEAVQDGSGKVSLRLDPHNLVGQLTQDGSDFAIPTGMHATISFRSSVGNIDYSPTPISADGSFSVRVPDYDDTYDSVITITGSATYSSFEGPSVIRNFYGGPLALASSPEVEVASLEIPISASANFAVETDGYGAYLDLVINADTNNEVNLGPNWAPSGAAAWNLADGTYQLKVTPTNRHEFTEFYDVIVLNGNVTVKKNGVSQNPIGGSGFTYLVSGKRPNLWVAAYDPTDSGSNLMDVNGNMQVGDSGRYFAGFMGLVGFEIPASGTYRIEVMPGQSESSALLNSSYLVTANLDVTPATFSIVPASGPTATYTTNSTSVVALPMNRANFSLSVQNPDGTPFEGGYRDGQWSWLDPQLQKLENGIWRNKDWLGANGGLIQFLVRDAGTYRVRVAALNDSSTAPAFSEPFVVTGAEPAGEITQLPSVRLVRPNFFFNVSWQGQVKTDVPFEVSYTEFDERSGNSRTNSGTGLGSYFFSEPGSYTIVLNPNDQMQGGTQTKFTVDVTQSGDLMYSAVFDKFGNQINATAGIFDLAISAANVRLALLDPELAAQENVNPVLQYAYATVYEVTDNGKEYVESGWTQNNEISMSLPDGTYQLELDPNSSDNRSLARTFFSLVVSNNGSSVTVTHIANNTVSDNSGYPIIHLLADTANLTGRVMIDENTPFGSGDGVWASVGLQKLVNGDWIWTDYWTGVDSQGYFSLAVNEAGTYRVRVEPQGVDSVSTTIFSLEASFDPATPVDLILVLEAPSLKVKVTLSGSSTPVAWAGLEIRKNGDFFDWANTGESGTVGLNLPSGDYEVIVHPSGDTDTSSATRKLYQVTVTDGGIGSVTGLVADGAGIFPLALGVPSLAGRVLDPDGNLGIRDSQVVPVDESTGYELWEYSVNTNSNGYWSMALPEGSYRLYARSPWGSTTYGHGARSGLITVDAEGNVSVPSGYTAGNLELRVSLPTWSGRVVAPGTNNGLRDTQICLVPNQEDQNWHCTSTNNSGYWVLSAPDGFTGFDDYSELNISEWATRQYAEKRLRGAAVATALGGVFVPGRTYANIILSPEIPNLIVHVTAGGSDASGIWVNVDRPNEGWLGGASTDSEGNARLFISDLFSDLNIQAQVDEYSGLSGQYASTRKTVVRETAVGEQRTINLALDAPNFFGTVSDNSASLIRYSWVDAFDIDTNEWVGGTNTLIDGSFSLRLEKPSTGVKKYQVNVNPPWNAGTSLAKKTYTVTVDSTGAVIDVRDASVSPNAVVSPVAVDSINYYNLTLRSPSVFGKVVLGEDSNAPGVRDSWVVPLDNSSPTNPDYLWELGTNSRNGGNFSLGLVDGNYLLEANPAWNTSGSSKSALCNITVGSGAITSGSSSCWNQSEGVTLRLRAPNLTFTLTDGTNPVPYANVGVGYGNWHTWAQADKFGKVSLFIDSAEIFTRNPELANLSNGEVISLNFWFDPPYGNSDVVRWDCQSGDEKPICSSVPAIIKGQENSYLSTALNLGNVAFARPNTSIRVTDPSGTPVGAGAWVSLMRNLDIQGCSGCREWLGGSQTNSLGYASFNIPESLQGSTTFYVEVNPDWQDRDVYAAKTHLVSGYSNLNGRSFKLASPNLSVSLLQSDGATSAKWSWIGVEEVDTNTFSTIDWVNGIGLDRDGSGSASLAASKTFKLTAYPGSGNSGSRTTCYVSTDADGDVALVTGKCSGGSLTLSDELTLTLSAGNVTGTVKYLLNGTPTAVSGAIVYAEAAGKVSASTVTKSNGEFTLELDPGVIWTLKVLVVNRDGNPVQLASDPNAATVDLTSVTSMSNVAIQLSELVG